MNSVLQVVRAIKKILYAGEDDASVVAEAQAMVSMATHQKEGETRTEGISDERANLETQKRKNIQNLDVDVVGITTLSPRQRISGVSDVHCSGSPLMTYWIWMELFNILCIRIHSILQCKSNHESINSFTNTFSFWELKSETFCLDDFKLLCRMYTQTQTDNERPFSLDSWQTRVLC